MHDVGKLGMLALLAICTTVMLAIGRIESEIWLVIISGEVGYLTGNGVNYVRRRAPSPAIAAPPEDIEP